MKIESVKSAFKMLRSDLVDSKTLFPFLVVAVRCYSAYLSSHHRVRSRWKRISCSVQMM